jgi:hypothetical protein
VDDFLSLLRNNETILGRLVTTAVMLAAAVTTAAAGGRLVGWRVDDSYNRYYARKAVHYVVFVVFLIATAVVWRPFAGRVGVVLGLAAAGVAFAMQEVIGALAGWLSILTGRQAVKDQVTRQVLSRLAEAGIAVASTTQDVTVRPASGRREGPCGRWWWVVRWPRRAGGPASQVIAAAPVGCGRSRGNSGRPGRGSRAGRTSPGRIRASFSMTSLARSTYTI